jgi:hypothetical protein
VIMSLLQLHEIDLIYFVALLLSTVCRFSIMHGVSCLGIIFIVKVCLLLSIQKLDWHFKMGNSFADAMKPGKFASVNFRRWATKLDLWLIAMDIAYVLKPVNGPLTIEKTG